jgi:hypothetical protein
MKKKVRNLLADKCKDFGLTDKALDELAKLGSEGLGDDASDEDIESKVDSLVPFAKAMQGEITRKTRGNKQTQSQKSKSTEEVDNEGDEQNENVPAWMESYMKPFKDSLQKLQEENATLKAEKAAGERKNLIAAKAKELGIPDYLMKRVSFADDADIDTELAAYKQELVTNNLMPKDAVHETGKIEDGFKADAKSWAESLPNK